jgi:hypothetical protein|tara:strand:+ start:1401 stop:1865 length:465 start_codon:yes stop_codon:yes gene_type:complete
MNQTIRSVIIPEVGLSFEGMPTEPILIDTHFGRGLAYLIGKGPTKPIFIEATSGGSLKVASTGSGLETYQVISGTANGDGSTYTSNTFSNADDIQNVLVEVNDAIVGFANEALTFGSDIILPVGRYSFDFVAWGFRIKSRVAGFPSLFQYEGFR